MDMTRTESDALGERTVPTEGLHGIHTIRAQENFRIAGRPVAHELVIAYGSVKLACARTNRALGAWPDAAKADAIARACAEMADGTLAAHVAVDALQGGAGTSTNMCVNEVVANRALEILGLPKGRYDVVSPLNDVNLHQSTNDTYPTALRLAAIRGLHDLEKNVICLQEAFQRKEKELAHVVKVARTELQDAVLITLGREMGSYAEAFSRDRWRIYKCEERLRVVNLGGTAVGTGLGAPRSYIFRVVDELRAITGIGFARAENLVDATQNADTFVEVSGILKACACSVLKTCNDLRLLASGPDCGLGEIMLPPLQSGSSIMPGKVNPVAPEAAAQAALLAMGHDSVIGHAAASGNLELNQYMPLIAHCLLESIRMLSEACDLLATRCVDGITVDEVKCRASVESATATATALVHELGYEQVASLVRIARETRTTIRDATIRDGAMTTARFNELTSPEAVCRLGTPDARKDP